MTSPIHGTSQIFTSLALSQDTKVSKTESVGFFQKMKFPQRLK